MENIVPTGRTVSSADDSSLQMTNELRQRAIAPRLVMMDDHTVEVPPAPHMVVVRNDDRAGMIGAVGTILGEAQVSISSMAVGPSATGHTALMVLSTEREVPGDALEQLRATAGISDVHIVET